MSRKLASIQKITNIEPIEGANAIELASVLGWKCVIKIGEFSIGDYAVYFEIDSLLPIEPKFEFLRNSSYRKNEYCGEGFRIKTIKLRGQISQGLLLPLSIIPDIDKIEGTIGEDVTEILGVKKWFVPDIEGEFGTEIKGKVDGVPTTAETRIQSIPDIIKEFKGKEYYISTKMYGVSCSVSHKDGNVDVMGHSNRYAENPYKCPIWQYVYKHELKEKLSKLGKNIAIQGELCGERILKNKLGLSELHWYVFDIVNLDTGEYYGLDNMLSVCDKLGLEVAPIEEVGESFGYNTVEELLKRAEGKYANGGNKEGIVIRTKEYMYNVDLNRRYSFKVINNKFLLKNEQ